MQFACYHLLDESVVPLIIEETTVAEAAITANLLSMNLPVDAALLRDNLRGDLEYGYMGLTALSGDWCAVYWQPDGHNQEVMYERVTCTGKEQ